MSTAGYIFLYSYILSLVNLITATTNNIITIFVPNFKPISISLKKPSDPAVIKFDFASVFTLKIIMYTNNKSKFIPKIG